jgi:hypothetical protein
VGLFQERGDHHKGWSGFVAYDPYFVRVEFIPGPSPSVEDAAHAWDVVQSLGLRDARL